MFSRILLATDGSECSLEAAEVTAALALRFSADLTLVTVFAMPTALPPFPRVAGLDLDLDQSAITARQEDILARTVRALDVRGVVYKPRREVGHPADVILRVAAEEKCDLIVLGSRGLGEVRRFLLGSVSDAVAHHAHCPVFVVRGRTQGGALFRNILLASDGSPAALAAAESAAALTRKFQAGLILLNVYVPATQLFPGYALAGMNWDAAVMEKAQEAVISCTGSALDQAGVHFQARKEIGSPAAEIARVAEEEGCDLIVLGSRGLGDLPSIVLGSVSNGVTHRAHCPVLIVR